ncbi:hypothetical protein [Absidia glauca]|uniref:Uncharacterized protein n=1 Tax=Absidia glauca TaxID=4829 RepID=A0A168MIX3_ABSGL|nr:hypothetical protein [Absidia glauca]
MPGFLSSKQTGNGSIGSNGSSGQTSASRDEPQSNNLTNKSGRGPGISGSSNPGDRPSATSGARGSTATSTAPRIIGGRKNRKA